MKRTKAGHYTIPGEKNRVVDLLSSTSLREKLSGLNVHDAWIRHVDTGYIVGVSYTGFCTYKFKWMAAQSCTYDYDNDRTTMEGILLDDDGNPILDGST
ncbi:MAG: hypothetical protein MPK75_00790 [Alphaproteobacteria bacterium]|nr:hypothetical protein [Alphaproteobacteria bacterium]